MYQTYTSFYARVALAAFATRITTRLIFELTGENVLAEL